MSEIINFIRRISENFIKDWIWKYKNNIRRVLVVNGLNKWLVTQNKSIITIFIINVKRWLKFDHLVRNIWENK